MNWSLLITGLLLLAPFLGKGQSLLFSQYVVDATGFNPAYAGSQGALTVTSQLRFQWNGLDGAPRYGLFSLHSPIVNDKLAAGLRYSSDQLGIFKQQQLSPSLAYRFRLNEKIKLSLGLQGHGLWLSTQPEKLQLYQPGDPTFSNMANGFDWSFGAGAFLSSDKAYLGIAVPDLMPETADSTYLQRSRAYLLHAGLVLPIGRNVQLKPNTLLRYTQETGLFADINLNVLFHEAIWLGASYRLNQQLAALVQLQLTPQWALGYSYETPLGNSHAFPYSTHEVLLQYRLYFKRSDIKSPRYF